MSEPKKKVRVAITFECDVEVPWDWETEMTEFWLNDGHHCLSNELMDEARRVEADGDLCNFCDRASAKVIPS